MFVVRSFLVEIMKTQNLGGNLDDGYLINNKNLFVIETIDNGFSLKLIYTEGNTFLYSKQCFLMNENCNLHTKVTQYIDGVPKIILFIKKIIKEYDLDGRLDISLCYTGKYPTSISGFSLTYLDKMMNKIIDSERCFFTSDGDTYSRVTKYIKKHPDQK